MRARRDPSLGAQVVRRTALRYLVGEDHEQDRPAHVRAGSALVRVDGCFVVVQDDACFLAVIDDKGDVACVPVPSPIPGVRLYDDTRGNKAKKLDLEAAVAVGSTLYAFGSGSTGARETIIVTRNVGTMNPAVVAFDAHDLYAQMRARRDFAGDELNIEGAAVLGDDLWFFQRGNGAGVAVDATACVPIAAFTRWVEGHGPCPTLDHVTAWDLGAAGGVRLTFTDAAVDRSGKLAFLASAEASPDATRDGPVTGVAIGRIDPREGIAVLGDVRDETGAPLTDKAEGLAFDADEMNAGNTESRRAFAVVDKDDPDAPAELLELALDPGWRA